MLDCILRGGLSKQRGWAGKGFDDSYFMCKNSAITPDSGIDA